VTLLSRRAASLTFAAGLIVAGVISAPIAASAQNLAAGAGGVAAVVRSDVSDFSFTSYDADYYLAKDAEDHSTLRTVETFVAKFPNFDQNRGIIRAIPNDYDGVPLETIVISVTDANGKPVPYESNVDGGFTNLALGTDDYVHGKQTYTITYTQRNVVRAFADTGDDELYWDTNGTGFDQSFGRVTARIHIDPTIVPALTGQNACYRGAQGSTDRCEITGAPAAPDPAASDPAASDPAAAVVLSASTSNLGPRENLSVAIGFTAGTFVQVPASEGGGNGVGDGNGGGSLFRDTPPWITVLAMLLSALGLGGVGTAIVRRATGPKDAKGRGIIIPQYSVPKGINLLEAADLIGSSGTAVSAQLVSLAVRRNIRIVDDPARPGGGDYSVEYLDDTGIDGGERRLLVAVFGTLTAGATQQLGVPDSTLASAIGAVSGSVRSWVVGKGLRTPVRSRGTLLIILPLVAVVIVSVVLLLISIMNGGFSGWVFVALFVSIVSIVITGLLGFRQPILTDAGAEQRDYLRGMRDYLTLAEKDRFRMLQSPTGAERVETSDKEQMVKLYEKLLPFAVLWGVEREWTKELAVRYEADATTPDWFVSNGVFNALIFSQVLGGFSSSVSTSSTPPVSTSGSSWSDSGGGSSFGGSFGGGFSGGGGGGGGGGGR
jgi:uncharacterized membrane protein YgcG